MIEFPTLTGHNVTLDLGDSQTRRIQRGGVLHLVGISLPTSSAPSAPSCRHRRSPIARHSGEYRPGQNRQ
jgi:hypothetical protein